MKQLNHIAVKRKLTSTIWKQTVLVLLSIHLILIAGGRLQAQTVINATLATTIQTALNNGNDYTVESTSDIIVSSPITKSGTSAATLTLKAKRHIYLQNGANITASSGALNMHLWADSDNSGDGINQIASNINTNGGWLKTGNDNQTAILNSVSTRVGGDVFFNGSLPQTITANNGQIDIYGETIVGNTSGLTINSGNGNVTLYGLLNSGNQYTGVNYANATWLQAQAQADADNNANTYLATITSRLENSIAALSVSYNTAWLGARRESSGFWRWEQGPEAGQGLTYTNWAANEPNNWGSDKNGLNYLGENALQFTGANGNWNDLFDNGVRTPADFLNYYVLETTLAASPVTINAGSGTVTFKAAVGGSKPLSSLSITAATTAINGGSVTTNGSGAGSQSYSGNIALGSASTTLNMLNTPTDFVLANGKSISNATNADASLTIKTTANIVLETNSSIASSVGKLNTLLWSDSDANGGAIFVKEYASITSNGGNVTLSGGLDHTTGYAKGTSLTNWSGIRIDGSINSGTGAVLLRGEIGPIPANQNTLSPGGIFIVPSNIVPNGSISATSGSITLVGYVSSSVGSGNALRAIRLGDGIVSKGQANLTTDSGNIFISGTTIPTWAGAGVLFDSSKIQSGSGSITITGQQGAGEADFLVSSGSDAQKVYNQIISTSGNITVNANLLAVWGTGSFYDQFSLSSAGQLTIQPRTAGTTIGLGGGTGSLSLAADLVTKSFKDGFSSVTIGSASAGNITVSGSTTYSDPLTLKTAGNIITNSNTSLIGAVSAGASLVFWADADYSGDGSINLGANTTITTNGGHLWMGGGSGGSTWNGLTVGNGSAMSTSSVGILLNSPVINSGAGNIYLAGKSTFSASNGHGIFLNGGSINSTSGMIDFSGTGSAGSYTNCDGLRIAGTVQSETGSIRFTGYSNTASTSEGIALESGALLKSTSSGSISLLADIVYFDPASRLQSSGTLAIYPTTPAIQIGVGGASGTLLLPSSYFSTNIVGGFNNITIGSTSVGDITISGTTTYSEPLTFKTAGNIFVSTGASLTGAAAGSDGIKSSLIFWADADANSIGGVWFQPSSSFTTNGGQIYIGGGTDGNSDQLPDGYAYGTYDFIRPFNGTDYDIGSGILIEGNLNSGGGDITAWGFAPLSISHSAGVHIAHSGVVNAGGGNILLNGQSDKGAAYIRGVWIGDGTGSASSAVVGTSGAGTLAITGQSASSEDVLLDASALSTESGNITIDGDDYMLFNAGPTTNTITSVTGKVQIVSNAITISAGTNTIRSNGELVISPKTSSRPISLGTYVAESLNLPSTFFTNNFLDGFSQITVGSASQTGNITSTSLTFRDNMRLQTASPAKVVVTANNTLTLNAGVKLTIDKELELQTGAKIIK